jgi:hypothetical protein
MYVHMCIYSCLKGAYVKTELLPSPLGAERLCEVMKLFLSFLVYVLVIPREATNDLNLYGLSLIEDVFCRNKKEQCCKTTRP